MQKWNRRALKPCDESHRLFSWPVLHGWSILGQIQSRASLVQSWETSCKRYRIGISRLIVVSLMVYDTIHKGILYHPLLLVVWSRPRNYTCPRKLGRTKLRRYMCAYTIPLRSLPMHVVTLFDKLYCQTNEDTIITHLSAEALRCGNRTLHASKSRNSGVQPLHRK